MIGQSQIEFGVRDNGNPLLTHRDHWGPEKERQDVHAKAQLFAALAMRAATFAAAKELGGITAMEISLCPEETEMVVTLEIFMPRGFDEQAAVRVSVAAEARLRELLARQGANVTDDDGPGGTLQ